MSNFLLLFWFSFLRLLLTFFHFAYSVYEYCVLGQTVLKRKFSTFINLPDSKAECFVSENVKELTKCPSHLVVVVGEEKISSDDFCNIILWCFAAKISYVSFYDYTGYLKSNESIYFKYLIEKRIIDPKCLVFNLNNANKAKNGVVHKINVRILSSEDGKPTLVKVTKNLSMKVLLEQLEMKEINEKLVSNEMLELIELPEPDLAVVCGPVFSTFGLLPWHIRVTEFVHLKSIGGITMTEFISILRKYSNCTQRFGK